MARFNFSPGDIFQFPTESDFHGYCQYVHRYHDARFFLVSTKDDLSPDAIVRLPVAFIVGVGRLTPGHYKWKKTGKAPVPEEYAHEQNYVHYPIFEKSPYVLSGKFKIPISYEEADKMEPSGSWEHAEIVERLLAQLSGKPSQALALKRSHPYFRKRPRSPEEQSPAI